MTEVISFRSLRPLMLSLSRSQRQLDRVRGMRAELQEELHAVIEEYAPKIWENFDQFRIHTPSADVGPMSPRRKATSFPSSDIINHPLTWLDERLFGWTQYDSVRRRRRSTGRGLWAGEEHDGSDDGGTTSGVPSGYTSEAGDDEEEDGDYDSVVGMLSRFTNGGHTSGSTLRSRRGSRASRSKSHLNLTEIGTSSYQSNSPCVLDRSLASSPGEGSASVDDDIRTRSVRHRRPLP